MDLEILYCRFLKSLFTGKMGDQTKDYVRENGSEWFSYGCPLKVGFSLNKVSRILVVTLPRPLPSSFCFVKKKFRDESELCCSSTKPHLHAGRGEHPVSILLTWNIKEKVKSDREFIDCLEFLQVIV